MLIGFDTRIKIHGEINQTEYIVGSSLLANLHKIISGFAGYSKFLLLMDKNTYRLFGRKIEKSLESSGKTVCISVIPSGEKSKDINNIPKFIKPFFQKGIDRKTCLIAVGGGVITDIGGFIASILLRGIDSIFVPTTLLGQIDAAIGGKNGMNFYANNDTMYKNMIGTIRQPIAVISDVDTLQTLPKKEIIGGLGEMLKYNIGWNKPDIEEIANFKSILRNKISLMEIIWNCQKIKIETVIMDPLDSKNIRTKLNLGHTVGHAVESLKKNLNHGECVALGIAAAAKISVLMNLLNVNDYEQILENIKRIGLPIGVKKLNISKALKIMTFDKKGGNFVLMKKIGQLIIKSGIDRKTVVSALKEISL